MAVFRVRPASLKYPVGLSGAGANNSIDYLVIAGGGGGGYCPNGTWRGGGGGAGGLLLGSGISVTDSTNYAVTVGAGGPGGSSPSGSAPNGSYSLLTPAAPANTFYYYAVGGGGGGNYGVNGGATGGSGGGGSGGTTGGAPGVPGQGNAGGNGNPAGYAAGDGGGAGGTSPQGIYLTSPFTGTPVNYANGGVGYNAGGYNGSPGAGIANRGSGGDGMATTGGNGLPGGKGVVIVRYTDTFGQKATGGTVTTPAGYVIHTFTGDGTFATNSNFTQSNYSIN